MVPLAELIWIPFLLSGTRNNKHNAKKELLNTKFNIVLFIDQINIFIPQYTSILVGTCNQGSNSEKNLFFIYFVVIFKRYLHFSFLAMFYYSIISFFDLEF